jgi:hypothetical protein
MTKFFTENAITVKCIMAEWLKKLLTAFPTKITHQPNFHQGDVLSHCSSRNRAM